ncbi:MAG: hypothetical protein RSF90_05745 [Pygmaiobacter sp.]
MNYEERLYDSELYGGCEGGGTPPACSCPECGAVLDSDEDLIYTSRETDYVLGCSRCVLTFAADRGHSA